MKSYDPDRVWERVQSPPAPDTQSTEPLIVILAQLIRIFQHLQRKLPAQQIPTVRELQRRFHQQLACLRGMQILICGNMPRLPSGPAPSDPADLLLRQCYAQTLRLRTEYENRRNDPAYGYIFRLLGNQLPEQSCRILELLGTTQNP